MAESSRFWLLSILLVSLLAPVFARSQPVPRRLLSRRPGVVFKIEDQGIGISNEDQVRIFSPNVRVARPETEEIRGVGLGLFIVKELVELMGGEIWVESELNRGSSFHFTLPVSD